MTRRRAVPAAIAKRPVPPGSIALPTDWSPEQAVAVFEILDELREHVWARYGLQIQQLLRDQSCTAVPDAGNIENADVPF